MAVWFWRIPDRKARITLRITLGYLASLLGHPSVIATPLDELKTTSCVRTLARSREVDFREWQTPNHSLEPALVNLLGPSIACPCTQTADLPPLTAEVHLQQAWESLRQLTELAPGESWRFSPIRERCILRLFNHLLALDQIYGAEWGRTLAEGSCKIELSALLHKIKPLRAELRFWSSRLLAYPEEYAKAILCENYTLDGMLHAISQLNHLNQREIWEHCSLDSANRGDSRALRALHQYGLVQYLLCEGGSTLAHRAAFLGHAPYLETLQELGFDLHIMDDQEDTPAWVARHQGNYDLARNLSAWELIPDSNTTSSLDEKDQGVYSSLLRIDDHSSNPVARSEALN